MCEVSVTHAFAPAHAHHEKEASNKPSETKHSYATVMNVNGKWEPNGPLPAGPKRSLSPRVLIHQQSSSPQDAGDVAVVTNPKRNDASAISGDALGARGHDSSSLSKADRMRLVKDAGSPEERRAITKDLFSIGAQRSKIQKYEVAAIQNNFKKAFQVLTNDFHFSGKRAAEFLRRYSGSTDSIHSFLTSLEEVQHEHKDSLANAAEAGNPGLGLEKALHELVDRQTASRLARLEGYGSQAVGPPAGRAKDDVAVVSGKDSSEPVDQSSGLNPLAAAQPLVMRDKRSHGEPTGMRHHYSAPPVRSGGLEEASIPFAREVKSRASRPQQASADSSSSVEVFHAQHQLEHDYRQTLALKQIGGQPEEARSEQAASVNNKPNDGGDQAAVNDAEVQGARADEEASARDTKAVEAAIKTTLTSKFGFTKADADYFIGDAKTVRYLLRLETKNGSSREAGLEQLAKELEELAAKPELVTSNAGRYRNKTNQIWAFINNPGSFDVQKALVDRFGFWVKNARKFVSPEVPWSYDLPKLAEQLNKLAEAKGIDRHKSNSKKVKELVAALNDMKIEKRSELLGQVEPEDNPPSAPSPANAQGAHERVNSDDRPAEGTDILAERPEDDLYEDMYGRKPSPTGRPLDEGEPSQAARDRRDAGKSTMAQPAEGEHYEPSGFDEDLVSDDGSDEGDSSVEDDSSVLFDNQEEGDRDTRTAQTTRRRTRRSNRTRGK